MIFIEFIHQDTRIFNYDGQANLERHSQIIGLLIAKFVSGSKR